jgi:hypothetical protein
MTSGEVAQQLRAAAQPTGARVAQPTCRQLAHIALLVLAGLGCSSSPAAKLPDAGPGPATCSAPLVCGGDGAVHACDGHVTAAVVNDCSSRGQSCSVGRCTSYPCQLAEARTRSVVGCLFYTLQPDNVAADEAALTSYVVNNAGSDPANVKLERATAGNGDTTVWTPLTTLQVPAGSSGRLQWGGLEVTSPGLTSLGAVRVSSDRPITVAEIESDGGSQPATSSSGTMLLPVQSLGTSYRAVTYPQEATADVVQAVGSRGGAARVIVVGTQPGTRISFTPVGPVTGDPGLLVPSLAPGEPLQVTLNDGDVFQIYTNAPDEDLTGSLVTVLSGASVAVFSGNVSTSYGSNATGINSADLAHEQMPPISSWAHSYLAAPLAPQSTIGCTSFFADAAGAGAGSIWRVVASRDDTRVDFGPPVSERVWLDAGQSVTRISATPFTVTANAPVLVTQGMDCEPSLALAVSTEPNALMSDLAIATIPVFDQIAAVVRNPGVTVLLDGVQMPDAIFRAVDDFDLAEIPLPGCGASSGACLHRFTASGTGGIGVTIRGMDVSASYALTVPGLLRCASNAELCVN